MGLWQIFLAGGYVMWVLLLCSVFSVVVAVQKIHFLSKVSLKNQEEEEIKGLLEKGEWEQALEVSEAYPSLKSEVLSHALQFSRPDARSKVYQGDAMILVHRMGEGLRYLDTIVTLSPLLGLLGTVLGMIQSFQVLSIKEGKMDVITGGVAEALVATAFGLIVAVLALCLHSYLSFRMDKEVTTLEEWGNLIEQPVERTL